MILVQKSPEDAVSDGERADSRAEPPKGPKEEKVAEGK